MPYLLARSLECPSKAVAAPRGLLLGHKTSRSGRVLVPGIHLTSSDQCEAAYNVYRSTQGRPEVAVQTWRARVTTSPLINGCRTRYCTRSPLPGLSKQPLPTGSQGYP